MDNGKQEDLESLQNMHLKDQMDEGDMDMDNIVVAGQEAVTSEAASAERTAGNSNRPSRSPVKAETVDDSLKPKVKGEDTVGGDVILKLEPGEPPKLSRSKSHKVERRPPQLFDDYEDKTEEATSVFSVLTDCTYANKYMGSTEHALECDCSEEWGKSPRGGHETGQSTVS